PLLARGLLCSGPRAAQYRAASGRRRGCRGGGAQRALASWQARAAKGPECRCPARRLAPAMSSIEAWWSAGERVPLVVGEREWRLFVRRMGEGPTMTLLHGFPSSSHDWAKVAPALAERHSLLLLDFLGFGASEKPREHRYSLHEQADLVEALWAREGMAECVIVAHDYAVSVTEELL